MELQKSTTKGNGTGTSHGLAVNPRNIETSWETITPAMAEKYLATNDTNRRLRQRHVDWLADQIAAGEWVLNGESIKFVGGKLVDGQHRLSAIIKSNKSIKTLVVRMPVSQGKDVFNTVDTGANRSTADILELAGERNAANLGSIIRYLYRMDSNGLASSDTVDYTNNKLNHQRILRLLSEKYPDARASATFSATYAHEAKAMMRPVVLGVAHYLFCQINETAATEFFSKLLSGADLQPRNPILVLRNKLISMRSSGFKGGVVNNRTQVGMTIKAWNLFRRGESCTHIRMAPNEEMPKPL